MKLSRRELLAASAALLPLTAAQNKASARLRFGVMDGVLRLSSKPEALAKAAEVGAAGLQVTLGREGLEGKLLLSDRALEERYAAESKRHGVPLVSTYLDILHASCLKSDSGAKQWVREGIEITKRLDAGILMLVFFGKCALTTRAEMDAVEAPLRELAPEAAKAGVILGFENTISAADNLRILDAVGSPALQVYYDIGNATNMGGFDPAEEIRRIGRARLCQFHFKDKGYLGEGKVQVEAAMRAIAAIGFDGYAMLETSSPSGSMEADTRRNLAYARGFLK